MPSSFRFAGIFTVIFAFCGPALGETIAPASSGVTVQKLDVSNGATHTVKYVVTGGSPQLQAVVRRVEWAENELSVVEQLQMLKLDTVVNDRRLAAFRTAQLTNPYYAPAFIPLATANGYGGDGDPSLQKALTWQLASEATPEAALQLIGFLEQVQTDLDVQLKSLPHEEKEAAEGPINALRPRLAALSQSDVPAPAPQPAVPGRPLYGDLPAPAPAGAKAAVEVEWRGSWYAAETLRVSGGLTLIHYTGWDSSWDEWVTAGRIRPAATIPPQPLTPPDSLALQQTVQQFQETVRQQMMQTQQQIMQRHP